MGGGGVVLAGAGRTEGNELVQGHDDDVRHFGLLGGVLGGHVVGGVHNMREGRHLGAGCSDLLHIPVVAENDWM